MPRPARLLPCPSCARHIKVSEALCPHCGSAVRQADGSIQRTAAAMLLGLSTTVAGCGDIAQPVYGAPSTGGAGGESMSGGAGGAGGETSSPVYGIPATGGGGAGGTSMSGGGGAGGGGGGGAGGGGGGGAGGGMSIPVYGAPPMSKSSSGGSGSGQ